MKLKNLNIKWMLFFYMFIFVFVLLIVLWLFQTVFLSSFYKAIKTGQINSLAKTIEKNIDSEDLSDLLTQLALHDKGISILIYNESGEILLSPAAVDGAVIRIMPQSDAVLQSQPSAPNPPILQREAKELMDLARERGGAYELRVGVDAGEMPSYRPERFEGLVPALRGGAENLTHVSSAVNKSGETIYILIHTLITPVDATVMTLRYQLVAITIVLLLLALLLSLYFSKKFAKPIMEINEVAKQLTVGNYDIVFGTGGYREINELNDTLNSAAFELSRVEGLRRELLANVSHDLRTPLTMITGFAEMIRDLPGENTPANAQIIVDESNRLTRLVSDLLDISSLESGNVKTEMEKFCITDTIKNTIERISASGNRQIVFEPCEDAFVNANESQIIQVIYNLIANALNYSESDVTVKQKINEKTVRIEVCDSGQGIPKEELPYVWERYYKASEPHKRSNIGTGLGLSIVRGVIGRHGGQCGASSTEGIGSVFWFELKTVSYQ